MVIHDVQEAIVKVSEDEVVVCPLPASFVDGLSEACEELAWQWIAEHAPKSIGNLIWFGSECAHYAHEAEMHGGRVCAALAHDVTRDLPEILRALEAGGGNLRCAALIGGGVA
ncbi:MAG: hypothetical protein NTY23_00660 [Chloroflexi bacterium]|nr:hypothetical protein [Chloroflexota bacterium]